MSRFWLLSAVSVGIACAALAGCAHEQVLVVKQTAGQTPIPLFLRGADTQMRIAFPSSNQIVRPGEFKPDEICYLTAGDCRIDCFTTGSSLNLGPTDSNDLLADNPMSGIEPADGNALATQTMKIHGVLFLVGGSIDRLPGTLSDYIQSPDRHLIEVLSLTDQLLNQKHVQFHGFAAGGTFTVTVELTDSGRDKLMDALDAVGESSGATQWVKLRSNRADRHTHPKSKSSHDRHLPSVVHPTGLGLGEN